MSDTHSLFSSEFAPGTAYPERPKLLIVDDQPVNIQVLYQVFSVIFNFNFVLNGFCMLLFSEVLLYPK